MWSKPNAAVRIALTVGLALALAGCDSVPVAEAKKHAALELNNPDSVRFENVHACNGENTIVVGKVNAADGSGAYAGYKYFFHAPPVTVFADKVGLPEWKEWIDRCFGPEASGDR